MFRQEVTLLVSLLAVSRVPERIGVLSAPASLMPPPVGAGAPPTSPRSVLAIAGALAARRWREVGYANLRRFFWNRCAVVRIRK